MAFKIADLKVADYMSPRPISVPNTYQLPNAIYLMAERVIGNLVVEKHNNPEGILTEREILDYLVLHKSLHDIPLSSVALSKFTSIPLESSIVDAARTMISNKARLLVYGEKHLVGIITATDMVCAFRRTESNPDLGNVLSLKLYMIDGKKSILESVKLMHDKRIGSVIVTKNDQPYGIFTERDLLVNVLSNDVDLGNPVIGYCSYPLVTAEFGIKGGDAARLLSENRIKRLVLTKDGEVSAIVTARDIVDAFQSHYRTDI